MFKKNDGIREEHILQNQFTAYLMTSIIRYKARYRYKVENKQINEVYLFGVDEPFYSDAELLDNLPPFQQLEDERLINALDELQKHNIQILYMKAIEDKSFQEISNETHMGYSAVKTVYHRLLKKLFRELGGK